MIQGVIFDMDGVLLDNLDLHLEAWKKLGEESGRQLTDEAIRATFGQRNQEMLAALLGEKLPTALAERKAARKEEIYRDLLRPVLGARVVDGLRELLKGLERRAVPMAIATSGPLDNVRFVLEGLGLGGFDAIVTGTDVVHGKPDPEVFLKAAERLGLRPASCVVFEDSPSGVRAARAADCACVALTTSHSEEELAPLKPDLISKDFTGFGLDQLLQLR